MSANVVFKLLYFSFVNSFKQTTPLQLFSFMILLTKSIFLRHKLNNFSVTDLRQMKTKNRSLHSARRHLLNSTFIPEFQQTVLNSHQFQHGFFGKTSSVPCAFAGSSNPQFICCTPQSVTTKSALFKMFGSMISVVDLKYQSLLLSMALTAFGCHL